MLKRLRQFLTDAGIWLSRPWAAIAVVVYALFWLSFDPGTFGWSAVAVLVTLLMTLFIQRSEHRDTQAIHAKLDEMLRVHGKAENRLADLDDQEPEQVERFRETARRKL